MSINIRLKKILALNEMTQKQLSEITGIRPPTISALCNNSAKHIPVDVMDRICNTLNCQPSEWLEYIPDEE